MTSRLDETNCAKDVVETICVSIGEYKISGDSHSVIASYALGSCLGVVVYDSLIRLGGVLHFMLPKAALNEAKAQRQPAMFGDTGMAAFINEFYHQGASPSTLDVKLIGGASVVPQEESFDIGKRNILLAKRLLWKNNLAVSATAVGGNTYRSLWLHVDTGRIVVKDNEGSYEM